MLPKDFPPFTTVQYYFYRWRDDGTWLSINHALVIQVREREGREASPECHLARRDAEPARTPIGFWLLHTGMARQPSVDSIYTGLYVVAPVWLASRFSVACFREPEVGPPSK